MSDYHDPAPPPLIIVEGFLGSAGELIWGRFEDHLNWNVLSTNEPRRRAIFASVGPVSSLHDRACELFYAILGGTVDYGQAHADTHNHGRYGRMHSHGLYPSWSRSSPLHFLGHSMGGATIIKLQDLIKNGHFGPTAHPDMIQSVISISSPFRGTQIVYTLGESTDSAPNVRPFSCGHLLTKGVHIISFLSPWLPRMLDLHVESRALSCRDSSLGHLLKQLWKSDWAEGRDATPYDVTFEAVDERESAGEGVPHENTFYRSHVSSMTYKPDERTNHHTPTLSQLAIPFVYILSKAVGMFDYSTLRPIPSFLDQRTNTSNPTVDLEQGIPSQSSDLGEEYFANDGIVPVFSQWHPLSCSNTKCRHHAEGSMIPSKLEPGRWEVHELQNVNHGSIVPLWTGSRRQRAFWGDLGDWLHTVDIQASRNLKH